MSESASFAIGHEAAVERMLRALNEWALYVAGARAPIRADEVLDQTRGLAELDPYDLFFAAGKWFGVSVTRAEVRAYGGLDEQTARDEWLSRFRERWTWRGLAYFLVQKLGAAPVRPALVLGSPCGPAGAFCALCGLVERVTGRRSTITPSERISKRISGTALLRLWTHIHRLSEQAPPALTRLHRYSAAEHVIGACVLSAIGAAGCCGAGYCVIASCAAIGALASGLLALALRQGSPALPPGIWTYRDLAKLMWSASGVAT